MTAMQSSMVMDVSQMFVASTTLRAPPGGFWNTFFWSVVCSCVSVYVCMHACVFVAARFPVKHRYIQDHVEKNIHSAYCTFVSFSPVARSMSACQQLAKEAQGVVVQKAEQQWGKLPRKSRKGFAAVELVYRPAGDKEPCTGTGHKEPAEPF